MFNVRIHIYSATRVERRAKSQLLMHVFWMQKKWGCLIKLRSFAWILAAEKLCQRDTGIWPMPNFMQGIEIYSATITLEILFIESHKIHLTRKKSSTLLNMQHPKRELFFLSCFTLTTLHKRKSQQKCERSATKLKIFNTAQPGSF